MRWILIGLLLSFSVYADDDDDDGQVGPQGPQGIQGIQGATGAQGVAGTNGTNGAAGQNGTDGSQGLKGDTGTQGVTGKDGRNGSNGKDGLNGEDGAQGVAGTNSISGANQDFTPYGIASAIAASQLNFDYGTSSWQWSASMGAFESNKALSFGIAKKTNGILINGSLTQEDGRIGGGIGISGRF